MANTPTLLNRFEEIALHPQLGYAALGIRGAETLYEHSREMADLAHKLVPLHYPEQDLRYVGELCMVHSLSELVPAALAPRTANGWKQGAIDHLMSHTSPHALLPQVSGLFAEFVNNQTPAARIANQLDKLQTSSRLLRYEQTHPHLDLTVLWALTLKDIRDDPLKQVARELFKQRPVDVEQRDMIGQFTRLDAAGKAQAQKEVAERVDLNAVRIERAQAFSKFPYSA